MDCAGPSRIKEATVTPGMRAILGGGLALLLLQATGPARAADAGAIMTGSPGSTDTRIGQDIADLAQHFGVALKVVLSQGGSANIEALAFRPDARLGIVPSDTLDFLATFQSDPELRRRAERLRVGGPLHAEEVHVLARPGIATLADLGGKRVGGGRSGQQHAGHRDAAARHGWHRTSGGAAARGCGGTRCAAPGTDRRDDPRCRPAGAAPAGHRGR